MFILKCVKTTNCDCYENKCFSKVLIKYEDNTWINENKICLLIQV